MKRLLLLTSFVFALLLQPEAAKHQQFVIENCVVSSFLSEREPRSSVFISYSLLEEMVGQQLLANGFQARNGEPLVEFPGKTDPAQARIMMIKGDAQSTKGMFSLTLKINGEFYKESPESEEILMDVEVGLLRAPRNFGEALLGLLTAPINFVMASVISIVFPFINENLLEENDYMNIKIQGGFNFFTPLIEISRRLLDSFLSLFGASTGQTTYPLTLRFKPQSELKKVLRRLERFEIGPSVEQTSEGPVKGLRIHLD